MLQASVLDQRTFSKLNPVDLANGSISVSFWSWKVGYRALQHIFSQCHSGKRVVHVHTCMRTQSAHMHVHTDKHSLANGHSNWNDLVLD